MVKIIIKDTRYKKFSNKKYRDAYIEAHIRRLIGNQIRKIRKDRNIRKTELCRILNISKKKLSKIENLEYQNISLKLLLKLSKIFDIALTVRFAHFTDYFKNDLDKLSPDDIIIKSFEKQFDT